jgi:hypothetical protein
MAGRRQDRRWWKKAAAILSAGMVENSHQLLP